jgi:hypothetical protein
VRPIAKIRVDGEGMVTLDGAPIGLEALRAELTRLKEAGGVVWYYREDAAGEPPESAMAVIRAVVDAGLPISMSTRPDFSDVVSEDGSSQPRR